MHLREEIFMEGNLRKSKITIIDENIKINSYKAWRAWEREKGSVEEKLRFTKLLMKEEIYALDIIPFKGSTILVSERLRDSLIDQKITCIRFSEDNYEIEKLRD